MIVKYNKILWALFFAQIVIAVVTYSYSGLLRGPDEPQMLLALKKMDIQTLQIEGPGEKTVSLTKAQNSEDWNLPDYGGFPANSQAVMQLLDRLTNTELGMQVSKQSESFGRMRVADDNFERKIVIGGSDEAKTIFFGSAPSLRQAHARLNGENSVYAVKFAPGDIDLEASDWIKKDILVIDENDIKSIKVGNLRIQRKAAEEQQDANLKWDVVINDKVINKADIDEVNNFVKQVADMQIDSIGTTEDMTNVSRKIALSISVVLKNDENIRYTFSKLKDEEDYLMSTSLRPESFRLPPLSSQKLLELSEADKLINESK